MIFRVLFSTILSSFLIVSCSSKESYDTSTPEGAFKLGEKYDNDERYEEAVIQYSEVKNKFPYSKLATEAELRIADVQFKREAFIEAQSAYEVFKELHPKHPRSDYVTYRLALSFFNQLPSTIDRDLSLAQRALLYFDEVLRSYPNSEFVGPAKEHKAKAREMLAEKEFYIGQFYAKRDLNESALTRFEALLRTYGDTTLAPKALAAASRSSLALSDKKKSTYYYEQLQKRFPKSDEFSDLKSEIGDELSQR